ncbi:hypothetical protein [Edaphobacter flagellatus]|uniref:hypothetical protein n=1 Tax=Edaphobacter flagellatus TaxID=1933044 RepID=UPI0021B367FB|nr:hypothetical protein [Edaphobacter flagellatus]
MTCRKIAIASIFTALLVSAALLRAQVEEPRPIIFAFDVDISLSDKAAMKLKMQRESIVVSAVYSGAPKPIEEKRAEEIGMIDLGVENVEVVGAEGMVRVTGTKIDIKRLDWMKGPVMLNVNVFSGRHASGDNILACDFFDGKLSSAVKRPVKLHCSLITEGEKTRHKD